MISFSCCVLCALVCLSSALPLYGEKGGYSGYASYQPLRNKIQDTSSVRGSSGDSFRASAGSPEIARRPGKKPASSPYNNGIIPKRYEALRFKLSSQHGYDNNKIGHDVPPVTLVKADLYGQRGGGYKMADVYQKRHIQLAADEEKDYKDDYVPHPQPYQYGYRLKDESGNTQHKHESSDGSGRVHGSYGFKDESGVYRTVEYVADKDGFRAAVKTNEPGTGSQDPADVRMESEQD